MRVGRRNAKRLSCTAEPIDIIVSLLRSRASDGVTAAEHPLGVSHCHLFVGNFYSALDATLVFHGEPSRPKAL